MYNFRTDLASERRDIYKKVNKLNEIDGVESTEEEINEKIKLSKVKITNKNEFVSLQYNLRDQPHICSK